jgi:glutaredoxin
MRASNPSALALVFLLCLPWLPGCSRRSAGTADAGDFGTLPKLVLAKERKDLLFTYIDEQGRLRDVDSADKVPETRRKQVLVRDLSKRPSELKADSYVFVADLTREENGAWPYTVISRYLADRSVREGDLEGASDDQPIGDAGERLVILYGTRWCGACAQARSWLTRRGVAFVDKDIEADPKAQAEMARKMKRAGMQLGGVPVIDVGGKLLLGFDEGELERLLKQ